MTAVVVKLDGSMVNAISILLAIKLGVRAGLSTIERERIKSTERKVKESVTSGSKNEPAVAYHP